LSTRPSGAIFALDKIGREILDRIKEVSSTREELVRFLLELGYQPGEINTALMELEHSEVISVETLSQTSQASGKTFPLQRVVFEYHNQCNLACTIATSTAKTRSARQRQAEVHDVVGCRGFDRQLIKESGDRPSYSDVLWR